jgi:excisionase family DNA binding protein
MESHIRQDAPLGNISAGSEVDDHNLITLAEIAKVFGCTEHSIAVMLRCGDLPGVKFGREWRVPRQAFWTRVNELSLADAAERRKSWEPAPDLPLPPRRGPGRPRIIG